LRGEDGILNQNPILFTQRESRWHTIFCACPAIAGKAAADCQGFAVGNYSFTLGRLEAGLPSTFAQLGLHNAVLLT
jgi:hypothetical protein